MGRHPKARRDKARRDCQPSGCERLTIGIAPISPAPHCQPWSILGLTMDRWTTRCVMRRSKDRRRRTISALVDITYIMRRSFNCLRHQQVTHRTRSQRTPRTHPPHAGLWGVRSPSVWAGPRWGRWTLCAPAHLGIRGLFGQRVWVSRGQH